MTTGRTFSDEDLTAFLDGEADDALAREIEAALEADQDLAARLEGLTVPIAALQRAFATQLSAAPAMPDVPSQVFDNTNAAPKRGFLPGLGIGLVAGIAGMAGDGDFNQRFSNKLMRGRILFQFLAIGCLFAAFAT